MTCFDIYLTSLALIGEPQDSGATEDYQKRALMLFPYINASLYRLHTALGGKELEPLELSPPSLDSRFDLKEELVGAASLELAALLILEKLPSVSEALKSRAEEEKARLAAAASSVDSTREVYGS